MFRYLCRTSFRRRFVLCIVLVLLFAIYSDTAVFKLKSRDEFASMLQNRGLPWLNREYWTDYETEEEFMDGLQDIYYRQYGSDASGILLSCFIFVPILVSGRCTDGSLRAACATGKSRRKQLLWVWFWFFLILFLICTLETAIYMRLLYTHVQRLPTTGQILRLLLMRPMYMMSLCSIPFAVAFLQSTLTTAIATVLHMVLWIDILTKNRMLFRLVRKILYQFAPYAGLFNTEMWQAQPNIPLILSNLLQCTIWIVVGLILANIFYAKSDVK